jgi:hypothetical protein
VASAFGSSSFFLWVGRWKLRNFREAALPDRSDRLERDDGDGVRASDVEENIQVFFYKCCVCFSKTELAHKRERERERGRQVLHVLLVKSVELSAFVCIRETCEEESGIEEEEEDNEWAARDRSTSHHHQPTVCSKQQNQ